MHLRCQGKFFNTLWSFYFHFQSAGLLNITVALDLSQFLKTEEDFVPWKAALRWIFNIAGKLSIHPIYGKYKVLHFILSL